MNITLSWDLFVIVFFGLVMSYSFIIGKDESVKVIIFTYVAMVAAQAAGNLLTRATQQSQLFLESFGIGVTSAGLDITKLIIFIATIVLLSIWGGFEVSYGNDTSGAVTTVLTGVFGFATAGLLLVALLTFIAGKPIVDSTLMAAPAIAPMLNQSKLMQHMLAYQDLWFCLPAALLVTVGVLWRE
ncbi:MAG: hypothetical protein WCX29_03830 [Candidatus Peribacteraceae bacterium]|jgi:hypothetical protein